MTPLIKLTADLDNLMLDIIHKGVLNSDLHGKFNKAREDLQDVLVKACGYEAIRLASKKDKDN